MYKLEQLYSRYLIGFYFYKLIFDQFCQFLKILRAISLGKSTWSGLLALDRIDLYVFFFVLVACWDLDLLRTFRFFSPPHFSSPVGLIIRSNKEIRVRLQSTPEQPEAPVENNVAHDVSTTESSTEPIKVTSPAVPSEVITASPPSAPAITEDVASVAKVYSVSSKK